MVSDRQHAGQSGSRGGLHRDPAARTAYAEVKRLLAEAHPNDRYAYADGKDDVVIRLRSGG